MSIPFHLRNSAHPVQVALRTYTLALSFSLGPSLVSFIATLLSNRRLSRTKLAALCRTFRRELSYDGFASAMTVAVGGGAAIRHLLDVLSAGNDAKPSCLRNLLGAGLRRKKLTQEKQAFISNLLSSTAAFALLRSARERQQRTRHLGRPGKSNASPTLDLTILLFVRAMDVLLQYVISRNAGTRPLESSCRSPEEGQRQNKAHENEIIERQKCLASRIDAFIFWACSARHGIMWCFFYEPQRLPRSYVKWIGTLADLDRRLLYTLNLIRDGKWSYLRGSPEHRGLLMTYASDLGRPKEWGDPLQLPPYGGKSANDVWQVLGVKSRPHIGGLPCEVVHGRVGYIFGLSSSCTANALLRGVTAFIEAVALYLPAHFVPVLLTRPESLLRPRRFLSTLLAALRSAIFLSTFVASYWYAVCFTRTLVLAKVFSWISHDFWDGPYGCLLAGSLVCGNSIWIENGRRRGEMALYVLPRALKTCLPGTWVRGGNGILSTVERIAFVVSLSTLLTAGVHRLDTLRGLSRWTLAFIMNGPNAGFWKRKRQGSESPPTTTTVAAENSIGRSDVMYNT